MHRLLDRTIRGFEWLAVALAVIGALIIVVQMLWMSYGVFMRYAVGRPDRMVTEATALLLFPVALAGLAYALREDSFPRVTMVTDLFPPLLQRLVAVMNALIMAGIGVFLSMTAVNATQRAFTSGAASEILRWPRWYFWAFVATALVVFTTYAVLRLLRLLLPQPKPAPEAPDGLV
jgi:TRAP-type C4-dicarboxylate transport system permease small subunit